MERNKITLSQIQTELAEAIKNSGMTQVQLARVLGVCQQTVSSYVCGRKMPALDMFANLCAVLDVDPAEILCLR